MGGVFDSITMRSVKQYGAWLICFFILDVLPASALRLDMDKMDVPSLLENKRGVYILRGSQNAQSKRALSVWTGDRVRHYMIFYDEKLGYALDPDGPRFDKIEDLLRHYYDFDLPKCDVKLKRPYK